MKNIFKYKCYQKYLKKIIPTYGGNIMKITSAHPLFAVCVQGFGPQLVQDTISFGTVESLFLSPYTKKVIRKLSLVYLQKY